jgi:N-acetylmuramoyl-L-alanine amidase
MIFASIAIDCGHGVSPDTGADGVVLEDIVTEAVGEALRNELMLRGRRIIMCRPSAAKSINNSLDLRVKTSNQGSADLFVSIHCNAYKSNPNPMGVEVFAVSKAATEVAKRVETQISRLGWKSRGVKDGSHLFVIKYTQAPAILIELFFCDSIADVVQYKKIGAVGMATAIASAILGETPLNTGKTLGQYIDEGGCSTAGLAGLNAGLIRSASSMAVIRSDCPKIKCNDAAVNLAISQTLEPSFWQVVNDYYEISGRPLRINSLYRTAAQQICLYEWFKRKMCSIPACAKPGTSNHEAGQAIDVEDIDGARPIFKKYGWVWQMDKSGNDPVHFEKDLGAPIETVLALQKYWNKNNPTDRITEDGKYGDVTRSKALQLPINGY